MMERLKDKSEEKEAGTRKQNTFIVIYDEVLKFFFFCFS